MSDWRPDLTVSLGIPNACSGCHHDQAKGENARMAYNLGLALQKLGRAEEAETALLRACKLSRNQTEYLYAVGVLYLQQKQWTRAKGCAAELLKRDPENREFQELNAVIEREGK